MMQKRTALKLVLAGAAAAMLAGFGFVAAAREHRKRQYSGSGQSNDSNFFHKYSPFSIHILPFGTT